MKDETDAIRKILLVIYTLIAFCVASSLITGILFGSDVGFLTLAVTCTFLFLIFLLLIGRRIEMLIKTSPEYAIFLIVMIVGLLAIWATAI